MRDDRVRVGILYAKYKDFLVGKHDNYKSVFEVFGTNNYSFCTVYRSKCLSYDEIKIKKEELREWYSERSNLSPVETNELGVVSFK